ncbi:MAG: serine hydrolase domain-containing protein [Acidobacteriota bacterium]
MLPNELPATRARLEAGIAEGLHFGAQLYISRGASQTREPEHLDLVVGERAEGQPMTVDTLNIWLSSTKPVTAVAVGLLWQRGALDLDDPVARHVPAFEQKGKGAITIRHLLTHTGGVRMLNLGWPEASWDEILDTICSRRPEPRWPPGEKAGYHLASSWFVLGEVVARVTGRPFPAFVRDEVLEPCGMDDSWIGMPAARFEAYGDRLGRMWSTENGAKLARRWHRAPSVIGCSPGGNGWGPIHELGRFYEMLLRRGIGPSGERLLTPQTVEAMTTPQRVGMLDQTFKQTLDWGLGFIIDSKHYGHTPITYGYGDHASRRTFGHSGFQSSTGLADPVHDLVVAMVVNGNPGEAVHNLRSQAILTAIYDDLGLAEAGP